MTNTSMDISEQLKWLGWILGFMLIVEIVNLLTGRMLSAFGVIPRTPSSLGFIFTAPFIHGSVTHFASNMVTLAVFTALVFQFGRVRFVQVSLLLITLTGLLVWVFGRSAIHIGASGVIYGYFGYLVLAGMLSRKVTLTLISIFVAIFYGTMIFGVLPSSPYISWESHLFGFLSGLIVAYFMRDKAKSTIV